MILPITAHLSEKTYALAKTQNTYVFKADKSLNKTQIKQRLESEYGVEIVAMKTLVAKGKHKINFRLRNRIPGRRKTVKKIYATLKEGDVIPIFTDHAETEKTKQQQGK